MATPRKNHSSKKSSAINKAVTPINQGNSAGFRPAYPEIEEAIRRRAYELYEERGRQEGFDVEDWARAEREILSRNQREKSA